jgi:DNA-binding NtrC family response regulator
VFVCVNCAPDDPERLETDLFGEAARSPHADPTSRGLEHISRHSRLYEARDGTLYLQKMAEAPARVQARLARILRDREAVLVETGGTIGLDIRPIAGVDSGFESAVQDGRIREDLDRRLASIRIDMPPLRNRREDIPALANLLLRDLCATVGISPRTLSRPALTLIAALPWRDNVSELQLLLESVATGLAGGRAIGLEEVLAHVRLGSESAVFGTRGTLRQARARFEREYIAAVLKQNRGRIGEAAKSLGIQRTNLYRKMRALRVRRPSRHA